MIGVAVMAKSLVCGKDMKNVAKNRSRLAENWPAAEISV